MVVKIDKYDHLGRGIAFINNKVCFVPFTVPGDEVEINIIKENKKYSEAKVIKYLSRSKDFIKPFCPYFGVCGGCQLQNISYNKTLDYKKNRVQNILSKVIDIPKIEVIQNKYPRYYRNKIELKIIDGKIGFYENKSHRIIEIEKCLVTKNCINNFFEDLKKMQIKSGDVTVRCNYNDELLISIKSKDNITLNPSDYPIKKVAGVILNDKTIYGENYFMDKVGNYFFKVSYDAFFQVNSFINERIFTLIKENVQGNNVLDLYSGVGTLAIMASSSAKKVYGIELVPNATLNATLNAKINKQENIHFIMGKVEDKIGYIQGQIDTIIVDPPRRGLDEVTIKKIKELKPQKIIYISCDTQSLANNLKELNDSYTLDKLYILDMFSYSYHIECICVLKLK